MIMSSQSLQTGTGSSATLLYGLDMCNQPLPALLQLKDEPGDDEELAMQAELKEHPCHISTIPFAHVVQIYLLTYSTPPQLPGRTSSTK